MDPDLNRPSGFDVVTSVIDAGGRFGVHPSWKPFKGELAYFMFEPDPKEANRLRSKYAHRPEIRVEDFALAQRGGRLQLNLLGNPAMSTSCVRKPVSPLFWHERKEQEEVVSTLNVACMSVDDYCDAHRITCDFLKLDTEGSELQILHGANKQLENSVLGVRCEVSFGDVFEGGAHFCEVQKFLGERGFFLLNLDYDGRGDFLNDFVPASGRYGILFGCDGVWLKSSGVCCVPTSERISAIRSLKYAVFCFHNNAPDLAIHILLEARVRQGLTFRELGSTKLCQHVDFELHRHLYRLKWQPGQSLEKHYELYEQIFQKPMLRVQEYNESLELNPD